MGKEISLEILLMKKIVFCSVDQLVVLSNAGRIFLCVYELGMVSKFTKTLPRVNICYMQKGCLREGGEEWNVEPPLCYISSVSGPPNLICRSIEMRPKIICQKQLDTIASKNFLIEVLHFYVSTNSVFPLHNFVINYFLSLLSTTFSFFLFPLHSMLSTFSLTSETFQFLQFLDLCKISLGLVKVLTEIWVGPTPSEVLLNSPFHDYQLHLCTTTLHVGTLNSVHRGAAVEPKLSCRGVETTRCKLQNKAVQINLQWSHG